jgi:methanogenic corrinoid protein MtbC1/predicted RNA binding protein YcfA (HicA-like mRNA interferase family)
MTEAGPSRIYSIGEAVAELQRVYPDVTHSSLRFLERDGFVEPERTPGGHRQYRRKDIDRVRMIKDWQAERLTLEEIRERIQRLESMPKPENLWPPFLDLALKGQFQQAAAIILSADEVGMSLVTIFQDILTPALIEVGRLWATDELKVGEEHEVTELCRDLISELTMRHMGRAAEGPVILVAAVETEMHDLGLRMVCGLLRQRGARVHFLGSNVATPFLLESVLLRRPDIVLLSVTLEEHRPSLERAIEALRRELPGGVSPVVVIGGQGGVNAADAFTGPETNVMQPGGLSIAVDEIIQYGRRVDQ